MGTKSGLLLVNLAGFKLLWHQGEIKDIGIQKLK